MNENAIDRKLISAFLSGLISDETERKKALQYINELPSVNPQPCEDAISRQVALDAIDVKAWEFCDYLISKNRNDEQKPVSHFADNLRECVREELPPVNTQAKTGHWIEHPEIETSTPEYLMFYECSECGDKQCFCKSDIHKKRFCGNCGCRMVEPQESEEV